jgi:hypothetical protein
MAHAAGRRRAWLREARAALRPVFRAFRRPSIEPPADAVSPLAREAQHNAQLLNVIARANNRLLARGEDGDAPWDRLMADTYDHVCRECRARRSGDAAPDAYLDALAQDPDIRTVCDEKQRLGQAVVDYRHRIDELAERDPDHEALEREIRNGVVVPDCTPAELQAALHRAIAKARKVLP